MSELVDNTLLILLNFQNTVKSDLSSLPASSAPEVLFLITVLWINTIEWQNG